MTNNEQGTEVRLSVRRDPVAGHTETQQLPQQEHHEEVSMLRISIIDPVLTYLQVKAANTLPEDKHKEL